MGKSSPPPAGSRVVYFYWHEGTMRNYPATVVSVFEADDDGTQALALEVELDEAELGITRAQSQSRQRASYEDTVHESGTWAEIQ